MPIRRRISDPKGFSRRLSKLRDNRGFTLAQLGRATGVSGTCVWNWENGNTFPKPETLRALAAALETTATYLVEGPDETGLGASGPSQVITQTVSSGGPASRSADKKGLSIAEAKEGLSLFFGVPVESVQITISG